ncbi:MAG: hypothetical protein AAGJ54_07415 [Planctomycetota bacterium]
MGTDAAVSATLDAMADSPRKPRRFHTKLARLLDTNGIDRLDLDRAADLPAGTVSNCLAPSRLVVPNAAYVVRLVRGLRKLGVHADVEWLADESDESPIELPEQAHLVASRFDMWTLIQATTVHYLQAARRFDDLLRDALICDWEAAAVWLLTNLDDEDEPARVKHARELAVSLSDLSDGLLAVPIDDGLVNIAVSKLSHVEEASKPKLAKKLSPTHLGKRFDELERDHPSISSIFDYHQQVFRKRRGDVLDYWRQHANFNEKLFVEQASAWLMGSGRRRLAELVTREPAVSDSRYTGLREELTSEGWIDDEGRPLRAKS